MPELALEMRQISKTYGGFRANNGIDFKVKKGTIHALAGENGAGKSTLMKILFGLETADEGNPGTGIFVHGKPVKFESAHDAIATGIGMVQQHFALAGALSALDNIILGAEPENRGVIDRVAAEVTLSKIAGQHLSLPWNKNVDDLSVGHQQRIEILKLLFRNAEILILDEPTAVLTPHEVEDFFRLLKRFKEAGHTIVIITHKLNEILSLCDEVTVLRHGSVTATMRTQGLTEDDIIKAMIGRDVKKFEKKTSSAGDVVLKIQKVTVASDRHDGLNGLNFQLRAGEILGIAGVEGNGQSALVETLLGLRDFQGHILYRDVALPKKTRTIRDKLNFGVISEDRHEQSIWLEGSISENCSIGFSKRLSVGGLLLRKRIEAFAEQILKPYNVKYHDLDQRISELSGGNQQKLVVAREVSARMPPLLIACNPTRGVDVGAIETIHHEILELQKRGSAILLVSSELEELRALSDRILVLFEGQGVKEFLRSDFDPDQIGKAMTGGSLL